MCPLHDNHRRRAFTLIELIATSALAALLVLATLSVIASVGRTDKAFQRRLRRNPWPSGLIETIRWDLANARTLETFADRVVLTGFSHLDPATLAPTHRPVEVVYSIRAIDSRRWLVRTQKPTDSGSTESPWSAPLGIDVQSLHIERLARPTTLPARRLPPEVKVTLRSSLREVPDSITTVVLHQP